MLLDQYFFSFFFPEQHLMVYIPKEDASDLLWKTLPLFPVRVVTTVNISRSTCHLFIYTWEPVLVSLE